MDQLIRKVFWACLLKSAVLFLAPQAYAQASPSQTQETPVMNAKRVEEAPVIDGRLDDPVWQYVTGASEFYQREPVEGEAATERTSV